MNDKSDWNGKIFGADSGKSSFNRENPVNIESKSLSRVYQLKEITMKKIGS